MSFDMGAAMSAWKTTKEKWDRAYRFFCLFSVGAFTLVWFAAKEQGATDTQLLCAILATATVMLLVMIGWVGMLIAFMIGIHSAIVDHSAHVTKRTYQKE